MKKLFLLAAGFVALCGCAKDPEVTQESLELGTKGIPAIMDIQFAYLAHTDPSLSPYTFYGYIDGGALRDLYINPSCTWNGNVLQYHCSVNGQPVYLEVSLNVHNVTIYDGINPMGTFFEIANMRTWMDRYSELLPCALHYNTFVDLSSIHLIDYEGPYNFTFNVTGIATQTLTNPDPQDPDNPDPTVVTISLEWNGSSWDIVASAAVASTITVICDGPSTAGYSWTLTQGSTRLTTGSTDPGFSIAELWPTSDNTYTYVF